MLTAFESIFIEKVDRTHPRPVLWEKEGMYNAVVAHTENYNICTAYRVKRSRLFALPLMAGSEG